MTKIRYKIQDIVRDTFINKIIDKYNISHAGLLYSILTTSPLDIPLHFLISVIASKFGISKLAITILLAFLL